MTARILIGTSGWSYDDWVGPVYPRGLAPSKRLARYADRFASVEVNSTFYAVPARATVDGWIERAKAVGPPFEFSVKAPDSVTHGALPRHQADEAGRLLEGFDEAVLAPLQDARLLGAVLLQLSPHVQFAKGALGALDAALDTLKGYATSVELRHSSWASGGVVCDEALALLRGHGAALCAVDGPGFLPVVHNTAAHAYVRFHGRRPDVWFESDRDDNARYDYRYTPEELSPWAHLLADIAGRSEVVRVYFNNHPGGKAVESATILAQELGVLPPQRPGHPRQSGLDAFGAPETPGESRD